MPKPTYWPLRQALSLALKHIVLTEAIPAVNADLLARMVSTDPARVPQFGDAQLVIGDVPVPGEPTLCFLGTARRNKELATGTILATLSTQIVLKTPWVADNTPEDFAFLCNALEDNLEDLLTSLAHRVIVPTNPAAGATLLPPGAAFVECMSLGSNTVKNRVKSSDGVTEYAGWMLMHRAQINLALGRTGVVGAV